MSHCPNCGDQAPATLDWASMAVCQSCGTTILKIDDRLLSAGEAGVMADVPLLVKLGDQVTLDDRQWEAVGHARFSYGPGWWDEFWLTQPGGGPLEGGQAGSQGLWLSIDEGDIVVQTPAHGDIAHRGFRPVLGNQIAYGGRDYTVAEVGYGVCMALAGAFPERLIVGERYKYVNLNGPGGRLLSAESDGGDTTWFEGRWLDPFELQVTRP